MYMINSHHMITQVSEDVSCTYLHTIRCVVTVGCARRNLIRSGYCNI